MDEEVTINDNIDYSHNSLGVAFSKPNCLVGKFKYNL